MTFWRNGVKPPSFHELAKEIDAKSLDLLSGDDPSYDPLVITPESEAGKIFILVKEANRELVKKFRALGRPAVVDLGQGTAYTSTTSRECDKLVILEELTDTVDTFIGTYSGLVRIAHEEEITDNNNEIKVVFNSIFHHIRLAEPISTIGDTYSTQRTLLLPLYTDENCLKFPDPDIQ